MFRIIFLVTALWCIACVDTTTLPTPTAATATTTSPELARKTNPQQQTKRATSPSKKPLDRDGDGFTEDVDCDDLNSLINPGAEELCDGTDNNCDGKTDEAWKHATGPSVGKQCAITTKAGCTSFGYWVCHPDKTALLCNAELREPSPEICNGIDDDCDGDTDEDWPDLYDWCRAVIDQCLVYGKIECDISTGGTYCTAEDASGVDEDCSPVR